MASPSRLRTTAQGRRRKALSSEAAGEELQSAPGTKHRRPQPLKLGRMHNLASYLVTPDFQYARGGQGLLSIRLGSKPVGTFVSSGQRGRGSVYADLGGSVFKGVRAEMMGRSGANVKIAVSGSGAQQGPSLANIREHVSHHDFRLRSTGWMDDPKSRRHAVCAILPGGSQGPGCTPAKPGPVDYAR